MAVALIQDGGRHKGRSSAVPCSKMAGAASARLPRRKASLLRAGRRGGEGESESGVGTGTAVAGPGTGPGTGGGEGAGEPAGPAPAGGGRADRPLSGRGAGAPCRPGGATGVAPGGPPVAGCGTRGPPLPGRAMSRLEAVANVALRVPGLALLDLLYRWDPAALGELLRPRRGDPPLLRAPALRGAHCMGHVVSLVLLLLPLRPLVKLYLRLLTALLLSAGHSLARDYVHHELESGFQGSVFSDPAALRASISTLAAQLCLCAVCCLLLRCRQPWLLLAPVLPVLARLCGLPPPALPLLDAVATLLTLTVVLCALGSHLLVPFRLAAAACRQLTEALEGHRLLALGLSLWSQLPVPLLFLVFWLVLFSLQLCAFLTSSSTPLTAQSFLFLLLSSLCKFYLVGFSAFHNGDGMHRGVTEGVTLLLLALQTGLLDLQALQRTFLLSIILFIVVTSTLQSMTEIADPILLALGASRNRSPWKHLRGISMCLFLLLLPCFMAYKIAHFFQLDFWLLILVSSCILTSLQVMGTLLIYALFMVELARDAPLERMDEVVYWVTALSRGLEFLVALSVVAHGAWESLAGQWSWAGGAVLLAHCYLNVWLRARRGWRSLGLRRAAAARMRALPRATRQQLRQHRDDVCAICFQDMRVAVVTPCSHLFHAACLRKWLHVQDTCPMCHRQLPAGGGGAHGDAGPEDPGAGAAPPHREPADRGPHCPPRAAASAPRPQGDPPPSEQHPGPP
ncbi:RING finger protein 145-like isoform 2-T2 [Amazona ochrocephala]